ncbi:MAG: hypothetical protein Q8P18_10655 [Pseudomonadota bacterium]|nr:hypothetical protein [Pseudomonadota bacterium]
MLPLLALSACLAPSVGAECEKGASRCEGDFVQVCDCPNLGGSGPFAMDVCTGAYQWRTRLESCAADAKICAETPTGVECVYANGEPPPPDPWTRLPVSMHYGVQSAESLGFDVSEPKCRPGSALIAAKEEATLPPVREACSVDLSRGGHTVVVTYLEFGDVEAAATGVGVLRARGDGGDPDESCKGGCKALVSGWVEDEAVLWVTTGALAWEADGCEVLRGFPRARRGMYRCAGVDP